MVGTHLELTHSLWFVFTNWFDLICFRGISRWCSKCESTGWVQLTLCDLNAELCCSYLTYAYTFQIARNDIEKSLLSYILKLCDVNQLKKHADKLACVGFLAIWGHLLGDYSFCWNGTLGSRIALGNHVSLCQAAFTGPPCVLVPVLLPLLAHYDVMKSCVLGCHLFPPAGSHGCDSV